MSRIIFNAAKTQRNQPPYFERGGARVAVIEAMANGFEVSAADAPGIIKMITGMSGFSSMAMVMAMAQGEPAPSGDSAASEEAEEPNGIAAHAPYLRRLNLSRTSAEAEAMNGFALKQGSALCAGNEALANEIERNKISPILAAICRRAALEALALASTQPGEEANFEACSDWLTNVVDFGFESAEDREEFKQLLS